MTVVLTAAFTHKNGANEQFDSLIQSIDVARQDFVTECELMREFSRASMGLTQFNDFVDEVYNIGEGQVFRKRDKLQTCFLSLVMALNMHLGLYGLASMLSHR